MTDERIRKGPSGPPIDVFAPSPSDANSIPVVNAAGDGFGMLAPGSNGQVVTSRDGVWEVGEAFGDDPPALLVTLFGTNLFYAFSASQITESNEEEPKYRWELPLIADAGGVQPSIAPDGSIFIPSATYNAVLRAVPSNNGTLNIYRIASSPAGATSPGFASAFAGQAPANALDPWTYYTGRAATANTLLRWSAGTTQGSTHQAWSTPGAYTGSNASNDMGFDSVSNLWSVTTTLQRFSAATVAGAPGALTVDVNISGSNWPSTGQSLAVSSGGDIWRSRYAGGGDLRMLNAAGIAAIVGAGPSNPAPTVIITSTELQGAEGIIFDYSGQLWTVSYDNHRIMRFAAADLTSSGAKTPNLILTGGGVLGNGGSIGPVGLRWFPGYGPLR